MEAWGLTDPGLVRKQNQDFYLLTRLGTNSLLAVVCDGMGGAKAGNVASKLAADVFTGEVSRSFKPNMSQEAARDILCQAVELANTALYEHAQLSEDFHGMGTTLVALLLNRNYGVAVNVGDSRVYRMNDNGIECVSTDHSLVELMVRRGELTHEQAKTHPSKNIITRAIGTETSVKCDTYLMQVQPRDNFLLCSDGLSNLMDDQEILFEVLHGAKKKDCCQRLLDIAKQRGASDNVTAVLVSL